MADRNFGNRSVPPMQDPHYPPPAELPKKPYGYGLPLTIVVMVALFVVGTGITLYLSTGSGMRTAPLSESLPQVSTVPKDSTKAQ
jgi:hypothetical protein